jgi:hypothetical protein
MCIVNPFRIPVELARRVLDPRGTAEALLDALVPVVVAEILRRIDLTTLVLAHLDLERILATVDLPALIRNSAGSMVSDSAYRFRVRGIAADDAVARLRARLLSPPRPR